VLYLFETIVNPEVWCKNKGHHIKRMLENHANIGHKILFIFHQQNQVRANTISVDNIELSMRHNKNEPENNISPNIKTMRI